MRGVNTPIAANHLNRFSNDSSSPIRVARDFNTVFGQTLLWPKSPDSARDPAGDLWRYLVTGGVKKIKMIKMIIIKSVDKVFNKILLNQPLLYLDSPV